MSILSAALKMFFKNCIWCCTRVMVSHLLFKMLEIQTNWKRQIYLWSLGSNGINDLMVWKWVQNFNDGHENIHNEKWSEWSSLICNDLSYKSWWKKYRELNYLHYDTVNAFLSNLLLTSFNVFTTWLVSLTTSFYDKDIQKFIQHNDKSFNNDDNCAKK